MRKGVAPWIVALAAVAVLGQAEAQTGGIYPARPVRWLVGFAPGASNDIIARIIAPRLSEALGQQVIVDNRTGASGMIAGDIVSKGPPDGYTLLFATGGPNVFGPLLTKRAPYKVEEFAHVVLFGYTPFVIFTHPAFPARNPREIVDYAKANPGRINWASAGQGSSPHFALLVLQAATGIDVTHVPYKGGAPALVDVASGQVQVTYASTLTAEGHLNSKRVKAVGVADRKRLAFLPDVPTLAEHGIADAEASVFFGMAAPPRTPRAIVQRLNAEANRLLKQADALKRLQDLGLEVLGGTPEQAAQHVIHEAAKVTRLIQLGKLRPE